MLRPPSPLVTLSMYNFIHQALTAVVWLARARKNPIGWPGNVALESTQRGSCDDDMHMDDFSFNTAMTDPFCV